MSDFKTLSSPLKLGSLELKNRITMAPMYLGYADKQGNPTETLLNHYEEMGASGAAMVVCENAAVDHAGLGSPFVLRIDEDRCIPGLAKIAKAIKKGGAFAGIQINHAGRFAFVPEPVAPSAVAAGKNTPRALKESELGKVAESFALAAARAKEAGFDLVELHGGTGYLLAQFLSPRTNKRKDAFGGPLKNRLRFPLDVIAKTIKTVGSDYPVGYRFVADEWLEDGFVPDEAVLAAPHLEQAGISYLSVVGGTYESFFLPERKEKDKEQGYMADLAAQVKNSVSIPVITAGRIQDPAFAEETLASNSADLIGLARVLLADPAWPKKALSGRAGEITPCEPNCSLCWKKVAKGQPVVCSQWTGEKRQKVSPGADDE